MRHSSETPQTSVRRRATVTGTIPRRGRPALALLIALVGALLAAPAASAAPTWLERVGVSEPGTQSQSAGDIAVAPNGAAVAAWTRFVGGVGRVEVALRAPGSRLFGTPKTLSDITRSSSAARVAIDDAGNAAAVFLEGSDVRASLRPAGGDFGPTAKINDANALSPDVAIANGAVVATWLEGGVVKAASRPANSPIFGLPETVPGTAGSIGPLVVMDPAGTAYMVFRQTTGGQIKVRAAIRAPGGAFAPTNDILSVAPGTPLPGPPAGACLTGTVNHVDAPQIAVDPQGRATVAFAFFDCRTARHVIKSSARQASGNFGPLDDVSDPDFDSGSGAFMDVAVDDENNAVIVWLSSTPSVVQAAARPSGGSFGAIQDVSGPGTFSTDPSVRFDPSGTATAVFLRRSNTGDAAIQSTARPRGGAFGAVVDISGPNDPGIGTPVVGPTPLGIDDEGNAVALWTRVFDADPGAPVTQTQQIMAASFDGAPPIFTGASIPAAAVVGQPVSFVASAFDRLTGASVTWSFGDGGSAGGAAAQHVFASPGAFTVMATATDAVGNARSTASTINVQLPPPIDRDGDGFFEDQDCNDRDANIRPNAREIPGNKVDENCDKRAAPFTRPPTLGIPTTWERFTSFTKLTRLDVTGLRAGAKVTLTCRKAKGKGKGPGCPFATKRLKVRKGKASATRLVRNARFRTGAVLEVKVTTPGFLTVVRAARFVNAKNPKLTLRCQAPGKKKLQRCR